MAQNMWIKRLCATARKTLMAFHAASRVLGPGPLPGADELPREDFHHALELLILLGERAQVRVQELHQLRPHLQVWTAGERCVRVGRGVFYAV